MTVKIEISEEQAAALKAKAAARGLTLEDWLQKLASQAIPSPRPRYSLSEQVGTYDFQKPMEGQKHKLLHDSRRPHNLDQFFKACLL